MTDRKVSLVIPMKASDVEPNRNVVRKLSEFPVIVHNYVDQIEALLMKQEPGEGDAAELAELLRGMRSDALQAAGLTRHIAPFVNSGTISDPDGDKGRLQ